MRQLKPHAPAAAVIATPGPVCKTLSKYEIRCVRSSPLPGAALRIKSQASNPAVRAAGYWPEKRETDRAFTAAAATGDAMSL